MARSNQKIVLLCAFIILSAALQAQSYKLRYNFEKGKSYNYELKMDAEITQTAMGQEMKMSNAGSIFSKITGETSGPQGNTSLLISIDSGWVKSHNPMKDTTVSLSDFANKRTRLIISPEGKIISSEVVDSVKKGLEGMGFTTRSLLMLAKLPVQDVKQGDTWKISDIDSVDMMGGKIVNTMDYSYTLTGTEQKLGHNCVKLAFTNDTKSNGKAKIMGMEFFIEGTGKTTGTVYFDPKAGLAVSTEMDTNSEMTMATTGQQNMIIPISQVIRMSQNLVK